ncbi:MAG TPA: response regulator transcription factor [Tepidisphaeraceae bacterium]|jgi:DNA-binding NarL/FixJ family response regulator
MAIKVLIADDHQILREGLRILLKSEPDVQIIGEASNGRSAVELAAQHAPDIVVMDVSMPDLNGVEATRQIIEANPSIKVIALSAHSDHRLVSEILKAGASGYILKDAAFDELINAIRAVQTDQVYLSPRIAALVLKDFKTRAGATGSVFSTLTDREREVLQLMAEGKATKEVAAHLHVSVKTVETHRAKIMDKLNLYSVAELTKYAIREGLTSLEV